MSKFVDITGQKFERLTVVSRAPGHYQGGSLWNCVCDCGKEIIATAHALKQGNTRSCGCIHREFVCKKNKIKKHHLYSTWRTMIARCYDTNNTQWGYYGGRGISVSQEWKDSLDVFVRDMGEKPNGTSLDRIDNDGNYCKENCRWATKKEQMKNRSPKVNKSDFDNLNRRFEMLASIVLMLLVERKSRGF